MAAGQAPFVVSVSGSVAAPAGAVYRTLADYRNGHPHILPRAFRNLTVERGGFGAGTVIRFDMRTMGLTRSFRAEVTEPQPGRMLTETITGARGSATTFTVDAVGDQCNVTISTRFDRRPGLIAAVERFMTARLLKKIYTEELKRLAARAAL